MKINKRYKLLNFAVLVSVDHNPLSTFALPQIPLVVQFNPLLCETNNKVEKTKLIVGMH